MSTKNIKYITRESYLNKSEEMLLLLSDRYFNKKRFLLGEGADKDKILFYLQMNNTLCTKDCELINFIQDKIEGKLVDDIKKKKRLTDFSSYLKELNTNFSSPSCSQDELVSECCGWSKIEW